MATFFTQLIENNLSQFVLIVLAITAFLVIWLVIITLLVIRSYVFSKKLFGDTKKENLKEILAEHLERVGVVQVRVADHEKLIREIQRKGLKHIQKVGVVRFNPFSDIGSDQSFAIAILDAEDNGLVVSSLHGRDRTRIYAKPVIGGEEVDYSLSGEEKEAIDKARKCR